MVISLLVMRVLRAGLLDDEVMVRVVLGLVKRVIDEAASEVTRCGRILIYL